ncbi:MAG TPA: IS110 family transposase [Caulobacteraceae bacterium]|nr:IS110 family transposase [Caulobacteraceae bacterium]
MEQVETNTKVAGIDAAKAKLDVAAHRSGEAATFANDAGGWRELAAWLAERSVGRVGIEASGGYERGVTAHLQQIGLEVVIHQPAHIRAFARFKRIKAKNDRIDAALIAAATAQVEVVRSVGDPELVELSDRLTAYEQAAELAAQLKTMLEHVVLPDLRAQYEAQLKSLRAWKKQLAKDLVGRIAQHPRLRRRFDLVASLPGVGSIVAASLVLRMPELGAMARGQAASLLGVAPFDRDTGKSSGERHIFGGRARVRRMVYLAAAVAKRTDTGFKAFAQRLAAAGKKPKVVLVAVMRKLIEAANTVLGRGTAWVPA